MKKNLLIAIALFLGGIITAQTTPCTLTGGVVIVPYSAPPIMMNATVNGLSQYTYLWSNGSTTSQEVFYSAWCVTITDIITGCDTTICESCIPTGGIGPCTMVYAPVCGCDGNIYNNDCIAMQNGIFTFTSALDSNGQLLPCNIGVIYGCTDSTATNYDPTATTDDGSCVYSGVAGCTDFIACNYDSTATTNDGSCIYISSPAVDMTVGSWDWIFDDFCLGGNSILGNYTNDVFNSDGTIIGAGVDYTWSLCSSSFSMSNNNFPNSDYFTGTYSNGIITGIYFSFGQNMCFTLTPSGTNIYGCTNFTATNYDSTATVDDGSCLYPTGCTDPMATNYDSTAINNDGSCVYTSTDCFSIANTNLITEEVIGTTTYDLQTNASVMDRLLVHNDGTISAVWTMSHQYSSSYSDRGTGYNFYDGTSWDTQPNNRLESSRGGWPSLISLGNGSEAAITHNNDNSYINNTSRPNIGTGNWSENIVTNDYLIWNRSATGGLNGNTIHMIGVTASSSFGGILFNGIDGALVYYRSQDGGSTWDITNMQLPGMDSSMQTAMNGDSYAIATKGETVVVAYFDDWGDSFIVKSTDNGDTWSKTTFLDFPVDKYTMDDGIDLDGNGIMDRVYSTDKYGAVILDTNGEAHVFYGIMMYSDDDLTDGSSGWFPSTNGISYWNESMGADNTPSVSNNNIWQSNNMQIIASALDINGDGVVAGVDSSGGYALYYASRASMPSAGIDSLGNIYLSYSAYTETADNGSQVYRHINIIKSEDGGNSWSCPVDVTPNSIWNGMQECVFGSMSKVVDNKIRILYQKDFEPGLAVRGDEDMIDHNEIVYLEVDVSVFDTTIIISACTDSTASNYDPSATVDDGSCVYCSISTSILSNAPTTLTSCDGFAVVTPISNYPIVSYGWQNSMGTILSTSDLALNLCNDAYIITVTDNAGCSFTDTLILGTVYGCTDVLATNYNGFASVDDGSCVYPAIYGCIDSTAYNYNASANTDDGSCLYCDLTTSLYVSQNSSPSACDGWVYASATTSNMPVAYSWSTGGTQNLENSLCTGIYTITVTDAVGCSVTDSIVIGGVLGCTDSTATNYNLNATIDDGSCSYPVSCTASAITGLGVSVIIHDRVILTFDNMNTYDALGNQLCRVDQLRIRYRAIGTSSWSQKNIAAPTGYDPTTGICNSTQNTDKLVLGLSASATYEWEMRVWYCATGSTAWVNGPDFTTADNCPNVGNLVVTTPTTTKATFTWDDSNGGYSFVRLKARVDTNAASWFNIGGMGVSHPTFTKSKNGLVSGETYRGQARTWCDPSGGAYKSPTWTSLVWWTQPTSVRLEGSSSISNLDVYPNPSRDVFNISFTSKTVQNLKVRILNVVGEELVNENLEQFVGEYTKQIDLSGNAKGIYFLEIETESGVVNKKLILQ